MSPRPPRVLVVTGPSGAGKGTLIRHLLQRLPGLRLAVSATTRPPRPGEIDGRDYHFMSESEFEERRARGEFLETATYAGNRYGTLRSELEAADAADEDEIVLLEIDLQGARQLRSVLPEAQQVFIKPPSLEALRARLVGRGSDTPEAIARRLQVAGEELAAEPEFDYVVVNDRLEPAIEDLVGLVARIWGLE